MAAMQPAIPYLHTSVFKLAKQRFGWLLILMISATFTGQIMRHFEDFLAQLVYLTAPFHANGHWQ